MLELLDEDIDAAYVEDGGGGVVLEGGIELRRGLEVLAGIDVSGAALAEGEGGLGAPGACGSSKGLIHRDVTRSVVM